MSDEFGKPTLRYTPKEFLELLSQTEWDFKPLKDLVKTHAGAREAIEHLVAWLRWLNFQETYQASKDPKEVNMDALGGFAEATARMRERLVEILKIKEDAHAGTDA